MVRLASQTLLRRAEADDLAAIEELLGAAGLPFDDCAEELPYLLLIEVAGAPVAVAGLQPAGAYGLLRSFVVAPDWQHQGLAERLYNALLTRAELTGMRALYLLTETAAGYFTRLGFCAVARAAAPGPIRATAQFAALCPASATLMALELPQPEAGPLYC